MKDRPLLEFRDAIRRACEERDAAGQRVDGDELDQILASVEHEIANPYRPWRFTKVDLVSTALVVAISVVVAVLLPGDESTADGVVITIGVWAGSVVGWFGHRAKRR